MMAMKLVDANHWAVVAGTGVFISFLWWFLLQIGLQQSPIPHHVLLSWGSLVTSPCLIHVNVLSLSLHHLCDICNQSHSVMPKELSETEIKEEIVTVPILHWHFHQVGLSSDKASYIFLSLTISTTFISMFTFSPTLFYVSSLIRCFHLVLGRLSSQLFAIFMLMPSKDSSCSSHGHTIVS